MNAVIVCSFSSPTAPVMAEIELAVNKHGYTLIETVNDYITVAFPLILMLMVLVTVVTELDVEVCASA